MGISVPEYKEIIMYCLAFLLGVTVHEFAHARAALSAGDDTARRMGRVSLNPFDHLDPVGTLMFAASMLYGFGIGWGKPVPVNPYNFRSPRWDNLKVSLWGPASNVITAFLLAMVVRIAGPHIPDAYHLLLKVCILFNLGLAFFNLIPVPPLDGSHILSSLLPIGQARKYDAIMAQFGMMILILLLISGLAGEIIGRPVVSLYRLFLGAYVL